MMSNSEDIAKEKSRLRSRLKRLRREQTDKDQLSDQIFSRLTTINEFLQAKTILFYIDVRDEVRTQQFIRQRLKHSLKVVVPYCDKDDLRLVELRHFNELESGAYGILEPTRTLKDDISRSVEPCSIQMALIPGLGFDAAGGRIGHGRGYYDRLLQSLSDDCMRVAIAYDSQIVDVIPLEPHDKRMDVIVTPSQIIRCAHVK